MKMDVEIPEVDCSRKSPVESPWVLVFDLGICKGCHTILQNFQGWKLVFSRISKGKVTNLKILSFQKSIFSTFPVWIFSGIAHVMPDVSFLKLMIMIEHIQMLQMLYLKYGQYFFLDKCLMQALQVNLKDPVLVQTLSCVGRK